MIKNILSSLHALEVFSEKKLIPGILFSVLSSAIVLPVGFLVKQIFDAALPDRNFLLLLKLGGVTILSLVISGLLSIYSRKILVRTTKQSIFKIRSSLINRLLHASYDFYIKTDISRFHKIAVYDTEKIDGLLNSFFSIVIPSVILSGFLTVVLFFIDWQMCLVFIGLSLISLACMDYLRKAGKKSLTEFQSVFSVFHQHTLFVLEYYSLIKATSSRPKELHHHNDILRNLNQASLKMIEGFTKINNLHELIFSVSSIVLLVFGGYQVIQGTTSIGSLVAFYFCLYLLKRYFNNINGASTFISEGNYSLMQYGQLISEITEEPYSGIKKVELNGDIRIDSISFSYPSKKIFKNFSLHLQKEKVTLLTGPNGVGKSTLIRLLLGFFKPEKGLLLANGMPYDMVDLNNLRTQISILFQENLIFSGTILENILYSNPGASRKDIDTALRLASLGDFISSLPYGEQTQIGEKGIKLSGGQRQKLALARCFLSKASLVILDEPTTFLDRDSIGTFIESIKNINQKPAILLVSHDTELSQVADEIYKL